MASKQNIGYYRYDPQGSSDHRGVALTQQQQFQFAHDLWEVWKREITARTNT